MFFLHIYITGVIGDVSKQNFRIFSTFVPLCAVHGHFKNRTFKESQKAPFNNYFSNFANHYLQIIVVYISFLTLTLF